MGTLVDMAGGRGCNGAQRSDGYLRNRVLGLGRSFGFCRLEDNLFGGADCQVFGVNACPFLRCGRCQGTITMLIRIKRAGWHASYGYKVKSLPTTWHVSDQLGAHIRELPAQARAQRNSVTNHRASAAEIYNTKHGQVRV